MIGYSTLSKRLFYYKFQFLHYAWQKRFSRFTAVVVSKTCTLQISNYLWLSIAAVDVYGIILTVSKTFRNLFQEMYGGNMLRLQYQHNGRFPANRKHPTYLNTQCLTEFRMTRFSYQCSDTSNVSEQKSTYLSYVTLIFNAS